MCSTSETLRPEMDAIDLDGVQSNSRTDFEAGGPAYEPEGTLAARNLQRKSPQEASCLSD